MPYQDIDVVLSSADAQAVRDAFATVLTKLPFLVNLTMAERKATFKAGPDSLSFLQNALSTAQSNPDIFPDSLDVPAFKRDVDLFVTLTELDALVQSVASQIDD